ncbi:hypothetical protein O1R50_23145 [Glycomyces luteolus]|uniref:Uncharacterized protein n=1 Tax=Glycomyces luteolus TaxID=2670330 RepID=A0A9X3PBV7_9ACTN|nr:hypothetical protein [Glycomyces luteolus]MDA1362538.1 hypothetical protein [Glycomyces luteolus]
MNFLTRRLGRKVLAVCAAVGLMQAAAFAAYLLGYEAAAVAAVMLTTMLLLVVGLLVLRRVGSIAEAVYGRRMELTVRRALAPSKKGEVAEAERAEYLARRLLAAYEQERYQLERRFTELTRERTDAQ